MITKTEFGLRVQHYEKLSAQTDGFSFGSFINAIDLHL